MANAVELLTGVMPEDEQRKRAAAGMSTNLKIRPLPEAVRQLYPVVGTGTLVDKDVSTNNLSCLITLNTTWTAG